MGTSVSQVSSTRPDDEVEDIWTCSKCSSINPLTVYPVCHVCDSNEDYRYSHRPVPKTLLSAKLWKCDRCFDRNDDSELKCIHCGKQRTTNSINQSNTLVKSIVRPMSVAIGKRSETDESNAEKISRDIITYCKQSKQIFVDDQFPPSPRSLGPSHAHRVARWLPVAEIESHSMHKSGMPWTIYNSPEPHDIHQGELGDCWLMAAIALITERPQMLRHILLTKNVNQEGVYLVRICHNGIWTTVVLDGNFPCTSHNTLAYSRAARRQLYVPLIEKACAKLFGSYDSLSGGTTAEGLQLLTGAPCNRINLHPLNETLDNDMVWAKLLSASEAKLLIGASTGCTDIDLHDYETVGLNSNHAYTVLLTAALPINDSRFLLLRDPHGTTDYSERWLTAEDNIFLRSMYNDTPNSTGVFWIEWMKFLHFFDTITISTHVSNQYDIRQVSQFTRTATDPVSVYYFNVTQTSSISVSLIYHRKDRKQHSQHTQSFVICNVEEATSEFGSKEVIMESRRGTFTHWSGTLKPAAYVVVPFSISFWEARYDRKDEIIGSYTLVIHSSSPISGVLIEEPPTLLSDCLIAATVKLCTRPKEGYCSVLYATPSRYDDKLIVVENQLVHDYLTFTMTMTEGNSVTRHSRNNSHTIDCIPPRHRQLICIIEWNHERGSNAHMSYYTAQNISRGRHNAVPPIAMEPNDIHTPRPF